MKNKLKQQLNRELDGVRISGNLKQRILDEAAASRAPSRRKNSFSIRPLAIAAAVMVTFGLTAGMIALRTEKPDLSATPLAQTQTEQSVVWVGDDGLYHGASICGEQQNMAKTTPEKARAEGRKACSACIDSGSKIAEELVWITNYGDYYHEDKDCSDLAGAFGVLEIEANTLGKLACPVCAGGEYATPSPIPWSASAPAPVLTPTPAPVAVQPTPEPELTAEATAAPEEDYVWATENGIFYHSSADCSGMEGSEYMDKDVAIEFGKAPCPTCMAQEASEETGDDKVYVHSDDELYYHADAYCGSTAYTVEEARRQVKAACPFCAENVEDDDVIWVGIDNHFHLNKYCIERPVYGTCSESDAIDSGRTSCVLCMNGETEIEDFECLVWRTKDGELYHRAQNCSGMKYATQTGKTAAEREGKQPCPVCMEEIPVWIEDGGYYHLRKSCSGVDTPAQVAEAAAGKDGKQSCPICYTEEELIPWRTEVWITGDYFYHVDEHCSEIVMLSDYKECCLEADAADMGKLPCEKCLAQRYEVSEETEESDCVWITDGSAYYHTRRRCMGIVNAYGCDVVEALEKGKQPCEVCAKQILHYDSDTAE